MSYQEDLVLRRARGPGSKNEATKRHYPISQAKLGPAVPAGLSTFSPWSLDLSHLHLIHITLSPAKSRCSTRMMGLNHPIPLSSGICASATKGKGILCLFGHFLILPPSLSPPQSSLPCLHCLMYFCYSPEQ